MKKLNTHSFFEARTVEAWELADGRYLQILDTRDILYGDYSVEIQVQGGMKSIWTASLERCRAYIKKKFNAE